MNSKLTHNRTTAKFVHSQKTVQGVFIVITQIVEHSPFK